MLRKKNVIDFLYNVIEDEAIEIYPFVKYESMDERIPCANKISHIQADSNVRICQLSLNRKYFGVKKDSNFLKAILLHEIGHAIMCNKSKIDNELFAHMWAIKKADSLKLDKVVQQLIIMILEWGECSYNDYKSRRYIMACRKFMKIVHI